MHLVDARKHGVSEQKLDVLAAWEEAGDLFSERERAALALTEAITEVADGRARRRVRAGRRGLRRPRTRPGHRDGRHHQRVEPDQRDGPHGGAAPLILDGMDTRSGAEIIVNGDVVEKLHRPGTDPRALRTRLRIAARVGFSAVAAQHRCRSRSAMRWRTTLAAGGNRCAPTR